MVTQRPVMDGVTPILLVSHEAEDHGWQFLNGQPFDMGEAMTVGLKDVTALDPTVLQVADLPPGWWAWRDSLDAAWVRGPFEEPVGNNSNRHGRQHGYDPN